MKFLWPSLVIICFCLAAKSGVLAQRGQNEAPLTNAAIVKLSKAGFKEKTIISIIAARIPRFDLTPDRMIELKRNGVSEKIIVAMLARQEGMEVGDDSWSDDPFFDDGPDKNKNDKSAQNSPAQNSPQGDSVDIFGSSGGLKGRTRNRGATGSVAEDTVTTGTATVRILRPPAEDGGVSKLEKTPTLTNDSIVELVEAGFSEGTIIRRIEKSPVDFDLSSAKLDELRKHRVSERIMIAMRAAMGDQPGS